MPVHSVVLVDASGLHISHERLTEVARALQTQVVRDFAPLWDLAPVPVTASLTGEVPSDASTIRIVPDDYGSLPLGVHIPEGDRPEALVRVRPDWTITASHEMLEMLADPGGDTFRVAPNIDPHGPPGNVQYLVEVCDPCQVYDYTIGNVVVSDFVTPAYFEAAGAEGRRVDFMGRLERPFDVPSGCSISWFVDGQWHQKQPDGEFVREVATADQAPPRRDRDEALGAHSSELRHDLLAARRAPLKELALALVSELLNRDPTMRLIIDAAVAKYGWSPEQRHEALREYQRFLVLRYLHPGIRVSAISELGDLLWHQHILDTEKYRNDCFRIYGGFLDHQPFYDAPHGQSESTQQAIGLYRSAFGAPISALADYCR